MLADKRDPTSPGTRADLTVGWRLVGGEGVLRRTPPRGKVDIRAGYQGSGERDQD